MGAASKERIVTVPNGWLMLVVVILMFLASAGLFVLGVVAASWLLLILASLLCTVAIFLAPGFFTLQPNEARVLILFGDYKGTVREGGFHWGNPFYSNGPGAMAAAVAAASDAQAAAKSADHNVSTSSKRRLGRNKVSLRARTLNGERLKVNDRRGNPVEIATVVVWHVEDTAMAVFDVDDYESYVATQSETALRHVASVYAYDHGSDDDNDGEQTEITLRGNVEEVSQALQVELLERLSRAGVVIDDARLTHLAYAPEIAQAMLRRQQAEAIIAARRKIVHGAVSMVEMALTDLSERKVVDLDDERKAAMVSNLMVVLCGEAEVHPVVNAGSLY